MKVENASARKSKNNVKWEYLRMIFSKPGRTVVPPIFEQNFLLNVTLNRCHLTKNVYFF